MQIYIFLTASLVATLVVLFAELIATKDFWYSRWPAIPIGILAGNGSVLFLFRYHSPPLMILGCVSAATAMFAIKGLWRRDLKEALWTGMLTVGAESLGIMVGFVYLLLPVWPLMMIDSNGMFIELMEIGIGAGLTVSMVWGLGIIFAIPVLAALLLVVAPVFLITYLKKTGSGCTRTA